MTTIGDLRSSAIMATIDNPDDGTPIKEMIKISDDFLLLVTERCAYRVRLADDIDPKRRNPALPRATQQKVLDRGTQSSAFNRTLFFAKHIFHEGRQPIDEKRAISLAFNAMISMEDIKQSFIDRENKAIAQAAGPSDPHNMARTVPAMPNVHGDCKSFFQKADHFALSLHSITRLFFEGEKRYNWTDFDLIIARRFGEDE